MFKFKDIELYQWDFWKRPVIPLDEQIITIVGPNGSGKTTFLDALRTLLNARASHKRDIKKYLRHKGQRSAIKAIVDNSSMSSMKAKPFAPRCFKDEVTLAIVIEQHEGKIHKKFYVVDGRVELENIFEGKYNDLTPTEYSLILQGAGLTRAVLKVIALEQGATDELCEKSPRELLELVFDVFGDNAVLEKYRLSLNEEDSLRREIGSDEAEFNNQQAQLNLEETHISKYLENDLRKKEREQLFSRTLNDAKIAKALIDWRQSASSLKNDKFVLNDLINKRSKKQADVLLLEKNYNDLKEKQRHVLSELNGFNQQKDEAFSERNKLEVSLAAFKQLEDMYNTIGEKDLDKNSKSYDDLKSSLSNLLNNENSLFKDLKLAREELHQLELDQDSKYVRPVKDFQLKLEKNGIEAIPLAKLIEVKDENWQTAIESLLGRDRFTILVDEADYPKAGNLGEKDKFRFYISKYQQAKEIKVKEGSALSMIELLDTRIPEWILSNLNHTCLIEKFDDHFKIKGFDTFITKDGYRIDKRGSVSVHTPDNFCGKRAIRLRKDQLKSDLQKLDKSYAKAKASSIEASNKLSELSDSLKIIQNYLTESKKLHNADARLKTLLVDLEKLNKKSIELRLANESIEADAELANKAHKEAIPDLQRIEDEEKVIAKRYNDYLQKAETCFKDLETLSATLSDFSWYSTINEIPKDLKINKIEDRLDDLDEQISAYEKNTTITKVHVETFERRKNDFLVQKEKLLNNKMLLNDITGKTEKSRSEYIRVLRTSIQFYKTNVEDLAKIANADVNIHLPEIENTLESINSAGLEISFAFDGKKQHKLDSGESSGGQKVMESLILLVALLKDSNDSKGGFVFIDEPFAHLDVVNVDRVGQFLQSTGAQYIITTPNTQNIGVFRPAKLTISTYKKMASENFAKAPSYIRR